MVGGRIAAALSDVVSRICSILLAIFFSIRLVSVHVEHPYSSIVTVAAWKKLRFFLSVRSDFHMIDRQSIAVHAFVSRVSMSVSVEETLLPRKVNFSTSFRELLFSVEMSPVWLKHIYSILCALTWKPMPAAARSKLCSRVSAWVSAFASIAVIGVVGVGNCLCGVPSASFLCQLEAVFFDFINRCSKHVV